MNFNRFACWMMVPIFLAVASPGRVDAAETTAAQLLPETTLLYAEIDDPGALLEGVLKHPLREKIEALPGVQAAYGQPQYQQFLMVVSLIETQIGGDWQSQLAQATGGGIAVGVDAETNGVALLVEAKDDTTQQKILTTIANLARQDAQNNGKPDPIESAEYRGVKAFKVDKAVVAVFDRWLLVTNKSELGKRVLDKFLDDATRSLGDEPRFQAAYASRAANAAGWGYVNIGALRDAGVAADVFRGQTDNAIAELLLGGILSNLQQTPYATATLNLSEESARLELATPHEASWVPPARQYYFGPNGAGLAPPLIDVNNQVLSLSTYRDMAAMWLQAGDLMNEKANEGIAKADSNLSTLFAGKDFGEDILGAIGPEMQLVVTRQDFSQADKRPAMKLPAFAVVVDMRDPETMQSEMRRTFQSLIGFLNVLGAQQGQPQMDLDQEDIEGGEMISATYIPHQDTGNLDRLPVNFNFSPSLAFRGGRAIVSSSKALARDLVGVGIEEDERGKRNTAALVDFGVLREILTDNRGQLVAQNMLEKGHEKTEAEAEIDTILTLVGLLKNAGLKLTSDDKSLKLAFEVNLLD